jgi:phage baseplate assembly protein gpV
LTSRTKVKTRKSVARLECENLEARWCPTVSVQGNTLHIISTHVGEQAVVTQDDAHDKLTVNFDGHTSTFASSKIDKIMVDLEGSRDLFKYNLASDFTRAKQLDVNLGNTYDWATLNVGASGVNSPLQTIRATFQADVHAHGSYDEVGVRLGNVKDAKVVIKTELDGWSYLPWLKLGGRNTFYSQIWGDLKGMADVKYDVYSKSGANNMYFWAKYNNERRSYTPGINIEKGAQLDLSFQGGLTDTVAVGYHGKMDGLLRLHDVAGTVNNDVTLEPGSLGSVVYY